MITPLRASVLTVSDRCCRGEQENISGRILQDILLDAGWVIEVASVIDDEFDSIKQILLQWCDGRCDVLFTTGGTGFAPRDVTPEATRSVIEREAAGIAEYIRYASFAAFPRSALSRGVAGIRERTIIINLPGSPGGVKDGLAVILPLLEHAVCILQEKPANHTTAEFKQDIPPQQVLQMETNLDDLNPEFYEVVIERLFTAGALDVTLTPIQMKKNRPATKLSVLAPLERKEEVAGILFTETSALGIRYHLLERMTLSRKWISVDTEYGPIRIKLGFWHGEEATASPEYEDVKEAALRTSMPIKQVYQTAQAAYKSSKKPSIRD